MFWHLTGSERLGRAARRILDRADKGDAQVVIPAIVWFELYYLNDKFRFGLDMVAELREARGNPGYLVPPMDPGDIAEFDVLAAIPEMHDRMIAVVARRLGAPCLTRDDAISASGLVRCIWDEGD